MSSKAAMRRRRHQPHRAPSARRAFHQSAQSVAHLIRKPRRLADKAKRLHHLRVQTRRTQAALDLAGPALRRKDRAWWSKRLRDLRRAAGRVRDLDLARDRFIKIFSDKSKPARKLLARLDRDRRKAARRLRRAIKDHDRAALERRLARALAHRPRHESPDELRGHAATAIARASSRLALALAADPHHPKNLHRIRRRLKALRYMLEIGAADQPGTAAQTRQLERLQKRLGEANDLHKALALLDDALTPHPTKTLTKTPAKSPTKKSAAPIATARRTLARQEARARQSAINALAAWRAHRATPPSPRDPAPKAATFTTLSTTPNGQANS